MSKTKIIGIVIAVFIVILMIAFYRSCREANDQPPGSAQSPLQVHVESTPDEA